VRVMYTNVEIEFKTRISKEVYDHLIEKFSLESNVFKQVNYYFDTMNLDLNNQKMVLRIRQKGEFSYKLTLKSVSEMGSFENHIIISKEQAEMMKQHGFKTKDYFEHIDFDVVWLATLENYRASTPYEDGTLFIDYNEYCGLKDYEIEYEVDHYQNGYLAFMKFLEENGIVYEQTKRKSERALTCVIKP
ncbi:MAG TPA: CYTH domain-containing protein, partial [Acholeplasma sp.]